MQWTNFDAKMVPQAVRVIHVTLSPRSEFYLNEAAMVKLGDPVAVRLMFNREERKIGITGAPLNTKASYTLRAKYGMDVSGRVFRATDFCRSLALHFDRTVMFPNSTVEDGILILDINSTVPAPRRGISIYRVMDQAGWVPPNERELS